MLMDFSGQMYNQEGAMLKHIFHRYHLLEPSHCCIIILAIINYSDPSLNACSELK